MKTKLDTYTYIINDENITVDILIRQIELFEHQLTQYYNHIDRLILQKLRIALKKKKLSLIN